MEPLRVFFDYACPFCLKAHENLPGLAGVELEWHPCEAHPRPDRWGPHSDLVIMAMYYARDNGVDLWAFHQAAYDITLTQRLDVENPQVVARAFADMLDEAALLEAITDGRYRPVLEAANRLAWETYGFPAVPSFELGGALLPAVENVGVTKAALEEFVAAHTV